MNQSLRIKVLASLLTVLVAGLLLLSLGLTWVVRYRFAALEERDLGLNRARLEEAIENRLGVPANKIPDWGHWDDAFKYIQDGNKTFEEANLPPAVLDNLNIDSLRFYNLKGERVGGQDRQSETWNFGSLTDKVVAAYPLLLQLRDEKPLGGFVQAEGEIFAIAAMAVRPTTGEGSPSGTLLFLRHMGREFGEEISALAKMPVRFEPDRLDHSASQIHPSQRLGVSHLDSEVMDSHSARVDAAIVDLNRQPIGHFSATLGREVWNEGMQTLRTLLLSTAALFALALTVVFLTLNRFVTSRMERLHRDIRQLEENPEEGKRVSCDGNDEISLLSRTVNHLLDTLDERNLTMREILQNVQTGFLELNSQGVVQPGCTRHCLTLLGTDFLEGRTLSPLLFDAPRERDHFDSMLSQTFHDILPDEVVTGQLPSMAKRGDKWISVKGALVRTPEGGIKCLLLTLSDVTTLRKAEIENLETQAIMKIIRARNVFRCFIEELPAELHNLAEAIRTESGQASARKILHTLKGNFSMFGMRDLSHKIHTFEEAGEISVHHLQAVESLARDFVERNRDILGFAYGEPSQQLFTLTAGDLLGFKSRSGEWASLEQARVQSEQFVETSMRIRADELLSPLAEAARQLAHRMGKSVRVQVVGGDTHVDHGRYKAVFDTLINAVRNAVDHGLELPFQREGKPEQGLIVLGVAHEEKELRLWVEDDGRGIDFGRLKNSVIRRGLCNPEDFDALDLDGKLMFIFENNVSTAGSVSEISGRGLGMGAIRAAALDLGGRVELCSEPGRGMRLTIHLPHSPTLSLVPNCQDAA